MNIYLGSYRPFAIIIGLFLFVSCRPREDMETNLEHKMTAARFEEKLRVGMPEAEVTNAFGIPQNQLKALDDVETLLYETKVDPKTSISGFVINIKSGKVLNWNPMYSRESQTIVKDGASKGGTDGFETELIFVVREGANVGDRLVINSFNSVAFGEQVVQSNGKKMQKTVAIIGLHLDNQKRMKDFTLRNLGATVLVLSDGKEFAEFQVQQIIDSKQFSIFSEDENETVELIRKVNNSIALKDMP